LKALVDIVEAATRFELVNNGFAVLREQITPNDFNKLDEPCCRNLGSKRNLSATEFHVLQSEGFLVQ
jgi:hypothetical protein